MQYLALADIEDMVNLVARAGDPTIEMPLPDRKRLLMQGTAEMVDADIWIWSNVAANASREGDFMAISMVDGGYRDQTEREAFYAFLVDPNETREIQKRILDGAQPGQFFTLTRCDVISDKDWLRIGKLYRETGLGDFLLAQYPLAPGGASVVGFHRRANKPKFSDRDRAIVYTIFQQVDWLHRHGSNATVGERALQLSPRERQVLVFLLGGDSIKEVAHRLALSKHTVDNYVKRIYKCFSVSSRGELLAHFLSGGRSKAR